MIKSLRKKLVLLYTLSTGFILIIVILILLIFTEKELKDKRIETFQSHMNSIINKLQFDNVISDVWLSQLEAKNNLIIHIEDNGNPLNFPGVLKTPTDRTQLIARLSYLASEEGLNIKKNSILPTLSKSSIFTIKGGHQEFYYGCIVLIPTTSGWRSFLLLQYLPDYYSAVQKQRIMFSLLGLAGFLALFMISLCFVSWILKPLEENNNRQTRFIAAASHELRSPLSVIRANQAAISDATPQSQKFLAGIDNECKRMTRLVDDMLFLASVDAKSWLIKKEPVETDTLLVETYESFLPLFQQKEITLLLNIPEEELPIIYGDRDRLYQIITILLDNALSYTPIHKTVILRSYVSNKNLYLEVEDQGRGISDKYKKLVFERFFRVDQSRNDKLHFGLGLSIAKELVNLQGGKILVRDSQSGGAIFVICFAVRKT